MKSFLHSGLEQSQSLLITGESGSGKTSAVSRILQKWADSRLQSLHVLLHILGNGSNSVHCDSSFYATSYQLFYEHGSGARGFKYTRWRVHTCETTD